MVQGNTYGEVPGVVHEEIDGAAIPTELRPYMDAMPDCPFPGVSKLDWVSGLVRLAADPPYPYPYETKVEWVRSVADLQWANRRDMERARQRGAFTLQGT